MSQIESPWLTLREGAAYVRIAPQKFREMVYAGKVPSYQRSEKRVFVNRADLDAMMQALPSASVVPETLR